MFVTMNGVRLNITEAELKALSDSGALQIGQKHDPGSTTLTATPLNGPFHGNANQFGPFSYPGVRPGRFNATQRPLGISSVLPLRKSDLVNEIIEIVTGVTDGTGNNATGFCGNPPAYGQLKTCQQAYTYGAIYAKTELNDLTQIGQRRNRADIPGQIYNDAAVDNPFLPQIPGITGIADSLSQLQNEFYTFGIGLERAVAQVHWLGTAGTQANTYRGIMTQWAGLDGQIKTGYVDQVRQVACPAADSVVASFNATITGTDANSLDFVEAAHDVYYAITQRAMRVGLAWNGVIVMRPEHFKRAVDVWACAYATYRCKDGSAGSPVNRDGMQVQALRIAMLQGSYLTFDGVDVPVVQDDGILREVVANNTYKSDMYFVPLSANGIPTLYVDYFDMGNQYAQEFASFTGDETRVINNGLYRVAKRTTGFCVEYLFGAKVRLILEAPFLAGRLDDTQYTYFAQTRDAFPGQSLYANGGVTYRS